jgi:septum formation protein
MKPAEHKIYLASKSPRRRELLRQIGVNFELLMLREDSVRGPDVSEIPLPDEVPERYVERVTREKALAAQQIMLLRRLPVRPVLTADTTVTIDGRILGKPADMAEAVSMLQLLSGRTHQVLTSVAIHHDDQTWQTIQRSDVSFAKMPDHLIESYCTLQEPYDKAGAYAVQGQAAMFIQNIVGSYSGIMGLPLFETAQLLQQAGIRIL